MKKIRITLILLIACITLLYSGCARGSEIENPDISDTELNMLFDSLLTHPVLAPDECPDEIICTDYSSQGLLRICYQGNTDAKLKLQVMADDSTIVYNLAGDGYVEDFPLQYGDGEYTARIMENTVDDQYLIIESKTFFVTLSDENAVYLNAVQNVDWDYDMVPIDDVRYIIAKSLLAANKSGLEFSCTDDLYNYIINNIDYDKQKVFDLLYDYLPNIEQTYVDGKGICYDYASLTAAMLRSINIPTKLVKGYASYNPDIYHAWNEIFLDGQWIVVDPTRDAALRKSGTSIDMKKDGNNYTTVYEY